MNKYEIIKELFESGMLHTLAHNMCVGDEYKDDLIQEIIMILLEYDDDKIKYMYDNKQLKFFCVRLIQNQFHSAHSPFYKKYKKYYTLVDGNKTILDDDLDDDTDDGRVEE